MHNLLKALLAGAYILLLMLLLLSKCHSDRTPAPGDIGGDGDIKITLFWDFAGDVDLHVNQPNGTELSFMYMDDSDNGGGILDVDDRTGGRGAAENAYWPDPMSGRYVVRVVYYRADSEAPAGGPVRVVVKINGQEQTYNLRLTTEHEDRTVSTFDYTPR